VDIHPKVEVAGVRASELEAGHNPFIKVPMRRLSIEVFGLADKAVKVDTVEVRFSETDNKLELFGVSVTPYSKHSTPEGDACTTILCRVRVIIKNKLSSFREMAKNKFNKVRGGCNKFGLRPDRHYNNPKLHGGLPKYAGSATLAPGGRNHPHGWHRHHRHHHHGARRVFHVIGNVLKHVFLPLISGFAIGAAIISIAQAVAVLVVRRRRNNAAAYQHLDQKDEEGRDSMDVPPKYEDEYVEPTEDIIDEKKGLL
jgi:hypothetical protein